MTQFLVCLLTLLFSLSGPAMGEYSDFGRWSNAAKNTFPKNPGDLLPDMPRTPKEHLEPNPYTRIRPEQHPLKLGETYAPRHHGQHYHVETRTDPTKSWNNSNNVTKQKPPGYVPGEGTGFLPGEKFPGAP
jgi:filamentous hemagglutinin